MLDTFRGRTVAIIGGGPSLAGFDLSGIPEHWPKIAVNNSYRLLPDAEALFFADSRWWKVHQAEIIAHFRGEIITNCPDTKAVTHPRVHRLKREYHEPIGIGDKIAGRDSGTMAVNLAANLGASKIVLFGIDMTYAGERSHWHQDHIWATSPQRYENTFAPVLSRMVAELRKRGIGVSRATEPGLSDIPFEPLVA